jgi:hypothetical protein
METVAGCVRFYYVLFLANEVDLWYYMADSLNWCNIEIYAGKRLKATPLPFLTCSLISQLQQSYAAPPQHSRP